MAEVEFSFNPVWMKKFLVIGFLFAVLAFELNVTYNSPIAFGDEGFHVSTAKYIGTNVDYSEFTPLYGSALNPEKFNRPPFWNLVEGSFYFIFGFSDMFIKFLIPFISFLTGLAIYIFLKKLYSETLGIIAAAVAVTIPSFVTYSVLFYTTVPYVFFFTIGFLSFLTAIKTGERKFWVLAGIFSGVSILTNVAGFFLPVLIGATGIIHLLKSLGKSRLIETVKTYGLALFLIALVSLPLVARNVGLFYVPGCAKIDLILQGGCDRGGSSYETITANQFEGRSLGGGTDNSVLNIGLMNYLQFAYGFDNSNSLLQIIGTIFVPLSVLGGLVVLMKKRDLTSIAIALSVIIFIGLFFQYGGLVQGRAEDTARYFLSAVPIIAVAAGAYWSSIRKDESKFGKIIIILVFVAVFALSSLNFYSKIVQLDSVKNFVPSFFQACDWVKENLPEDANLLSLQTYPTRYNCDRGAVWEIPDKADILLSNNLSLVTDRLKANGIGYVFVQKFSVTQQALGQSYPASFMEFLQSNNRTFELVYENGPRFGTQEFFSCYNSGCDSGNMVYKVNQ